MTRMSRPRSKSSRRCLKRLSKHRQLSSSTTETMMATVVIVVVVAVAAETAITKETTVATIEETVSAST